jgi:16S rRNA (cytosine1402-N4)-methyltransferase
MTSQESAMKAFQSLQIADLMRVMAIRYFFCPQGMAMTALTHVPVLLREILTFLKPRDGGIYLDCTFGTGGYARAILESADCRLIAMDRDPRVAPYVQQFKAEFGERFTFMPGCFGEISQSLSQVCGQLDGIVFDLGVSSPQLDEAQRGFSFRFDAPLDMRMSQEGESAADVVNTLPEDALANLIYELGEERKSRQIAKIICEQRQIQPICTTFELAAMVRKVVPKSRDGIDPATRTFQALRMYVNDELKELENGLEGALSLLAPRGILAVVSFHSLEDRLVKQFIQHESQSVGKSRHTPLPQERVARLVKITKKPIRPSQEETVGNPRARSAKLRVAEKRGG